MIQDVKSAQFVQQGDTHHSQSHKTLTEKLSAETKSLLKRDANVFLHQALSTPVMNVLDSAEGAYIYDTDGNQYLDLHGNGVHNIGFNNAEVIKAIVHQLTNQLTFAPRRYTNKPAIEFAEKLVSLAPEGLDRVLFCPGGSEAIEMAVMLAKLVTGRWKTISFWNQYHGNTYQSATLSGNEHFTGGVGPMVPGAFYVEYPNYYRNPWEIDPENTDLIDAHYLRQIEIILKNSPDVAAIVGTTVSSTPYVPSPNYWKRVRELCDEFGIFLIFDEIVCGLGRTGKFFAFEHYVVPDVVVMGKSLGGGIFPFAGIITKEEYNTIADRSIGHFTHEKSAVASAAGLAALHFMEKNDVVGNAERLGFYLLEGLGGLQEKYPQIGKVDGKGLLLSMDLVTDQETKERNTSLANEVLSFCLKNGLSFKVIDGNVLTFRPALIIDLDQAEFVLKTLEKAFEISLKQPIT